MDHQKAMSILHDCWEQLLASGMYESDTPINEQTVILGEDSVLDAPRFVALMSLLEQALIKEFDSADFVLVIRDIHDVNKGQDVLILKTVADYITTIAARKSER